MSDPTRLELLRCSWAGSSEIYVRYHDDEWGRPVGDDVRLFEKMSLEGFQSGLSWLTILRKRENFRAAFAGFDPAIVAQFSDSDVERLVLDAGIIRHRGKITSTINNAKRVLEVQAEFGSLAAFLWQFEEQPEGEPEYSGRAPGTVMATTPHSVALSKALRKRGFSFVGPTTMYALMQAMGMVNDHADECHCRAICRQARLNFTRPRPIS